MITVQRIRNSFTIREIFKDDWDLVTDDGCGTFEDFYPDSKNENKHFIIVQEDKSLVCLVMCYKLTYTLAECHLIVCKKFRGKDLTEHFAKVREFLLENTPIKNLITLLPKSRKYIYNYALKYGWKEKCTIKHAFLKDHILEDCVLLELGLL